MWCGDLRFGYDENDNMFATNDDLTLPIEEEFDFNNYVLATETRPCPIVFQKLVQNAIRFYLFQKTNGPYWFQFWKLMFPIHNFFSQDINKLIFECLDDFVLLDFNVNLLPHQIEALQFVSTRPRALLAAATGLGKTCVSLALSRYKLFLRTMIVCPSTLVSNWSEEIIRFIPNAKNLTPFFCTSNARKKKNFMEPVLEHDNNDHETSYVIHLQTQADLEECFRKLRDVSRERPCYFIISYNMLFAAQKEICDNSYVIQWDGIFFDEAHALRCHKSQRSKAAATIVKKLQPRHTLLLSATPSAFTKHWWNLLQFLHPTFFSKYFHYKPPEEHRMYKASSENFFFAERYINTKPMRVCGGEMRWNFDESTRMDELYALTRPFILCQTKDKLNLPSFVREHVIIGEATNAQLHKFCSKLHMITANAKKGEDMKLSFLQIVQETSKQKLPFVKDYLKNMLESDDERFIVWVHYKLTMQELAQFFLDSNIRYVHINGDTSQKERDASLELFKNDKSVRVALLSIDTCGTGLNMTFVNKAVYAELTYDHVAQVQSEGRCHRIGQKSDSVFAIYLVYKNSTDEMIWKSMLRKADVESIVLTNKAANFKFNSHDLSQEIANDISLFLQEKNAKMQHNFKKRKINVDILSDDALVATFSNTKKQLL